MKIIDKKNTYVEVEDVLAGEIFENEEGIYLKIESFFERDGYERNCVNLLTNKIGYVYGEVKIIKGAFVVGEN